MECLTAKSVLLPSHSSITCSPLSSRQCRISSKQVTPTDVAASVKPPVSHLGLGGSQDYPFPSRPGPTTKFLEPERLIGERHRSSQAARFAVDSPCSPISVHEREDVSMTWQEPYFLAESAVGLVECNSRGCRPVFRKQWAPEVTEGRNPTDGHASSGSFSAFDAAEIEGRAVAFRQRQEIVDQRSKGRPSLPTEFAEFVNEVWVETVTAEKYFRDAMRKSPYDVRLLTSFAQFAWQRLHDKAQAEDLFQKALNESPDNSDALASYALFLWESESESENEN